MFVNSLKAFFLIVCISSIFQALAFKVDLIYYLCPGTTLTLSAVGMNGQQENTYKWSNGATTQSITISKAEMEYYSVEVTDPHGNNGTAGFWVIGIPEKLTVEIDGPTSITKGQTLKLEAVTNILDDETYTCVWSGPNGFGANTNGITIVNANEANAGLYSVVATSQYGCIATAELKVAILPLV